MPSAQFKAFWDATGGLWQQGALAGKSVGVFFSTASQGGGQETTALTCECLFLRWKFLFASKKPVSVFFSATSQGGGQETTALTRECPSDI